MPERRHLEDRMTIARDVLIAMISSMAPDSDRAAVNEREFARRAVAFADALLEALSEPPGNGQ
jgi:hypothetical protein